jgi:hypothetical protein
LPVQLDWAEDWFEHPWPPPTPEPQNQMAHIAAQID